MCGRDGHHHEFGDDSAADDELGADSVGDPDRRADVDAGITRRHFGGLAVGAASALTLARAVWTPSRAAARALLTPDGLSAYANAMHIHTSWSEGQASLHAQLSEASANRIPVVWKTDHDWRELGHGAPDRISFTSLANEQVHGKPLKWRATPSGSLSIGDGGIVSDPASPRDPNPTASSLHIRAQSAGADAASFRFYANFAAARVSQRTNIGGQTVQLDVLPLSADGTDSYLEVLITLSYHPASSGRGAGRYQLSYRLGTAGGQARAHGLLGVMPMPVELGTWQQVTLDPVADVQALWPDLVATDNVLYDIWLGTTSARTVLAEGFFDNLTFTRTGTNQDAILSAERAVKSAYAQTYPDVLLPRGREVSYYANHLNAYGSDYIPVYTNPNVYAKDAGWDFSTQVSAAVHASGGLTSFNHPFGTDSSVEAVQASKGATLADTFRALFLNAVCGADILEVGYVQRGTELVGGKQVFADLATHQQLWDMLSRNGFYLTGNGVSDDHAGAVRSWGTLTNRFLTYTWAGSLGEADLLAALAAGRAYVGELGSFSGTLDLWVDDVVPMGSVSVAPTLSARTLRIIATGLPQGSAVRVLQGPVDHPGTATPDPGLVAVATLPDTAFDTGASSVVLDTRASSYVRLDVVNAAGRTIAFSNPVYLLAEDSRRPVPAARRATG